jgi:hypothetical protein
MDGLVGIVEIFPNDPKRIEFSLSSDNENTSGSGTHRGRIAA